MISYFCDDEGGIWVRDVLVPTADRAESERHRSINDEDVSGAEIENEAFNGEKLTMFFEERDVLFCDMLIGSIVDAMFKARKILLVITDSYLKDSRRQFEMHQAIHRSVNAGHGIDDVIFVLFDDTLSFHQLSQLHPSLQVRSALRWTPRNADGQQLFWRQLRDRLVDFPATADSA